jgi:hypothetical protein
MGQIAIEFDYRSDGGPRYVGPFPDDDAAQRHVDSLKLRDASWNWITLTPPGDDSPRLDDYRGPTGGEAWIGDVTPAGHTGCSFGRAPGEPRCGKPVTVHVIAESAIHGHVYLSTCDGHLPAARSAGPVHSEHAPGDAACLTTCAQEN